MAAALFFQGCASDRITKSDYQALQHSGRTAARQAKLVRLHGIVVSDGTELYEGDEIVSYMLSKDSMEAARSARAALASYRKGRRAWVSHGLIGAGLGALVGFAVWSIHLGESKDPSTDYYGFERVGVAAASAVTGFAVGATWGASAGSSGDDALQRLDMAIEGFNAAAAP
jgi:hypothetical protein